MSLTSTVKITATGSQTSSLDLGDVSFAPSQVISQAFANGTGADQANQIFTDQRTLAGTTSEELDLAGSLIDALGNTITFTKIKAIVVSAASANGGNIEVGGAAANGFNTWVGATGDYVVVPAGGAFAIMAPGATGFAVTAATADLLKINNTDAASGTYDITIIGVE